MKSKTLKKIFLLFSIISLGVVTSCSDQKTPDPGYASNEQVTEKVNSFQTQEYKNYHYTGTLNLFNTHNDYLDPLINVDKKKAFNDSIDVYKTSCASYYLRLPLHITPENWVAKQDSTKTKISEKLSRVEAGYDKVFYYIMDDGSLVAKVFGANKNLFVLYNVIDGEVSGKWNITIVYDSNGYLIKEEFATINAHKDPDSKTCYGSATYSYE